MTKKKETRRDQEKGMLDDIGSSGEAPPASPAPAAPSASAPVGWMGYVGGALWATTLGGVGFIAWLIFTGGA